MNHYDRHYRWHDLLLSGVQKCLNTLGNVSTATPSRPTPNTTTSDVILTTEERQRSARLMRVNHVGEICAQALYIGQSFTARRPILREAFEQAAQEEFDHLLWCEERLTELGSHKSYLNPLWFTGSLFIGTCAGLIGDRFSLGFLAETEQQVYSHLENHLKLLPTTDQKSRAIVAQMQLDEIKHATTAVELGGTELPFPIKTLMRYSSKIMTSIAYYV